MATTRVFFRFAATLLLTVSIASISIVPAAARARLIAVIIFRSTASAHAAAVKASKELAVRLAEEPGWDAIAIESHNQAPADVAASAGAELYVIGQYVAGDPPHVSGAAYRVATDERLRDFAFDLTQTNDIPRSVAFANIMQSAGSGLSSAVQTASFTPAPTSANAEHVLVPRGTVIVVSLDHQIN